MTEEYLQPDMFENGAKHNSVNIRNFTRADLRKLIMLTFDNVTRIQN